MLEKKFKDSISDIKKDFDGRPDLDVFNKLVDALLYSSCTEFTNLPEETSDSMKHVLEKSYRTFIENHVKDCKISKHVRRFWKLNSCMVDKIVSHTKIDLILAARQHLKWAVDLRTQLSNTDYVIKEEELRARQAAPKEEYYFVPKGVGDFLRQAQYFMKSSYENNETQTVNKHIVEYERDVDQLCRDIKLVADRSTQYTFYVLGHGTKQGSVQGEKRGSGTGPRIKCNDFLIAINNKFSNVNLRYRPRAVLTQCHAYRLDSKSFSNIEIHSLSSDVAPYTLMCEEYHFSLMLYEIESNLKFFEAGPSKSVNQQPSVGADGSATNEPVAKQAKKVVQKPYQPGRAGPEA